MACSKGKNQSPIDLKWKKPAKGRPLQFDYKPSSLHLVDTGHSIQINFDPGSSLVLGDDSYDLVHAQFRTSSEHTLSGNELPMELQFYHRNKQGKIAVVSVIMIEGRENSTIKEIWGHLPKKMSEAHEKDIQIKFIELLPPTLTYYHYTGSLTYPPCTEGVDWNVLNTPVTLSRDQILAYRKVYSRNKRQTQPLNGRTVTNY
jgi:carbonic anhydrase